MTYTITTRGNAYFNGRDAILHKDGKEVATLALQDSGPGVNVKHRYNLGTAETRAMREELPDDRLESILEGIAGDFWENLAPEIARKHGFKDVYQEGRSGGWCIPHPHGDWHCVIGIDDARPSDAEFELDELAGEVAREAFDNRQRYFDFAVEITELVESLQTGYFDDRVREEHAEWLVEKAAQAVEDARRFDLFMGDEDSDVWRDEHGDDAWDHDLTRGELIQRVTKALLSIDAGEFVIRVNMTKGGEQT